MLLGRGVEGIAFLDIGWHFFVDGQGPCLRYGWLVVLFWFCPNKQMLDQSEESIKTRDAHPALPHPAEKQAAPPRPAKLAKSAGRSGAKLTADSIDTPFHYARK